MNLVYTVTKLLACSHGRKMRCKEKNGNITCSLSVAVVIGKRRGT